MSIVDLNGDGIALDGFDPVSYWRGEPLQGSPDFTSELEGVTYWFANEKNMELFEEDPAKYIPRYGGYCAFKMADGQQQSADPMNYKIHDDQLYLFSREDLYDVKEDWEHSSEDYINRANDYYQGYGADEDEAVEMQNLEDSDN